jgi:hypothetical protein
MEGFSESTKSITKSSGKDSVFYSFYSIKAYNSLLMTVSETISMGKILNLKFEARSNILSVNRSLADAKIIMKGSILLISSNGGLWSPKDV